MAVKYINGQLYEVWTPSMGSTINPSLFQNTGYSQIPGVGVAKPIGTPVGGQQQQTSNTGMFGDPFGSAMSGNQSGTLQPYVNRMTQNASNALYGGLLNYQPQSMIAGNAGGTPQNSTVPQGFNIPSALQGMMGGQGLNFGNRSWMQGVGNG